MFFFMLHAMIPLSSGILFMEGSCRRSKHAFRLITQRFLEICQYSCVISMHSDEKSLDISAAQALCGIFLTFRQKCNKIDYMYEVQYGRTKD